MSYDLRIYQFVQNESPRIFVDATDCLNSVDPDSIVWVRGLNQWYQVYQYGSLGFTTQSLEPTAIPEWMILDAILYGSN